MISRNSRIWSSKHQKRRSNLSELCQFSCFLQLNGMASFVEDFHESSESEDCEFEPKPKRRRGPHRQWKKVEEFTSPRAAEEAVKANAIWKKCSTSHVHDGYKVEYRCGAGAYRVNDCPAGLYLLYHADSLKVSLFETTATHYNHQSEPKRGLSFEMKTFIREKFVEGVRKPNAILDAIRHKKMKEPAKSQISVFLRQVRKEKYGSPTVSATEIDEWCKNRAEVPADQDEPFVLAHHVHAESLIVEEQDLKIVMSTGRLLSFVKKSQLIQIDATYKLVWQGYPVTVCGTSDKARVFHPFAIGVCKGECRDDFAFIFDALRTSVLEWSPTILMADGSDAITAAFTQVFSEPQIRLMCYFHVLKHIEKYLKVLSKTGKSEELKDDIDALQHCQDDYTFSIASKLFLKKWRAMENSQISDFVEYFERQWLSKYQHWYEGAAPGYPSTNNGIEATNAVIKKEHTFRERLPVGQFLAGIGDLLVKWSKSRDPESPNCIPFSMNPLVPLREWAKAYHWAGENKKVLQRQGLFYTSSAAGDPITQQLLDKVLKNAGKWKTFDDFKQQNYSIWIIAIDESCLSNSHCSCPTFFKFYSCKHVLGLQIRKKLVEVPPEAKSAPLGQKRKRGRSSKAKQALLVQ